MSETHESIQHPDIPANIAAIRENIATACAKSGRSPDEVHLIAVSKIKPAADIEQAYHAGQLRFGESYVQELREKVEEVSEPVEWHFIGNLQSNKVKYLRGKVAAIHSVDRLSLAKEIDRQWAMVDEPIDIMIQVNVGDEEAKSGCRVDQLETLIRQVAELPNIRIKGLMCLPPYDANAEEVRPWFRQLRQLSQQIAALELPGVSMDELSMGMSGDYQVAIEEGATLIRVGTAIFGQRIKS